METIKVSRPQLEDLKNHISCELQLRDSPFGDGGLHLYCLEHKEFLLAVEE